MENNNNIFRNDFIPWIVKWGRATNLLGVLLVFGPCLYLGMQGIWPDWAAFGAALAIQFPMVCSAYIREPISFFAMLGVPGTYMAFLSGNISNLRVPASSIATAAAGLADGTEEGQITATIGCAVSTLVSTVFLTVGVIAGAAVLNALPPIVTQALNLLLPALFAGLLAQYTLMKPNLAAIFIPVSFVVYWLQLQGVFSFLPSWAASAVPPIICAFGAMFVGVWMGKKGK